NRGRDNQNPEQIYQTELNTDKAIPLIPPIVVDNYIHLIGKEGQGGDTFCLYHPDCCTMKLDKIPAFRLV
ncbi:MAG TPA: hypothetical protein PLN14_07445, partial [Candidatus Hydrothermia bacterium]|nr:hypothetical protein [Candidatus Hydrothermia bacterium]